MDAAAGLIFPARHLYRFIGNVIAGFCEIERPDHKVVPVPGELILWQVLSAMQQCSIGGNR
jgi:hypothetical protein